MIKPSFSCIDYNFNKIEIEFDLIKCFKKNKYNDDTLCCLIVTDVEKYIFVFQNSAEIYLWNNDDDELCNLFIENYNKVLDILRGLKKW
jgi:hypothetical protein